MDRNLGAPDVNYHGNSTGSVYYQFGRKDPFAGGTLYDANGNTVSISTIAWNSSAITQESSKIGKNVPYSIQNPLKFIKGTTWTTGDQYCPADGGTFMWQDPKATPSTDGKVKKSIFDPCPAGWMVPANGMLNSIYAPESTTLANGSGRYYYTAGTGTPEIYAFFPASGYRNSDASFMSVGNPSDYINFWTCSPSSLSGMSNTFRWSASINSLIAERACGYSVRCIQEYY